MNTNDTNPSDGDDPSNASGFACPTPLRHADKIILGHGGGGGLSAELVEQVFLPAFRNPHLEQLGDSAVLTLGVERLAFATDSFVVHPLFFPGGCIGDLAVNGTVNDLAMSGADPRFLSASFILEEGFSIASLQAVAEAMGAAAKRAGIQIVTGDTKVVERGRGHGCYVNTTGLGVVPRNVNIAPQLAKPGDAIILSGTIGDHGMAIMSVREGLEFESDIQSDTAPLTSLVQQILAACPDVHVLRDPTRGGIAATLNEIAVAADVGIEVDETAVPIQATVQSACEILGLDPLTIANEGKLLAFVPASHANVALAAMRNHEHGTLASLIGHVIPDHRGMVVCRTALGAKRVLPLQMGEPLPRIC